jgi:hypothetical protein
MTSVNEYIHSRARRRLLCRCSLAFIMAVMSCFLQAKPARAAGLTVVSEDPPPSAQGVRSAPLQSDPTTHRQSEAGATAAPKRRQTKDFGADSAAMAEEEAFMRQMVPNLDRQAAAHWLAGFISSKPWNCPLQHRKEWVEAILDAVERNNLPICKEILGLVSSLISIESGFHADPLVGDPSRKIGIEGPLKRAEHKFFEKYGPLVSMPPIPKFYDSYKQKYWPQLLACQTSGQVEVVAKRIAADLKKDSDSFPGPVKSVVTREIDKLTNVVRSKGSMQLKLFRARQAMKDRGEEFTDQELTDYMYTVTGGVDVGVAALRPMFVQYAARFAKKDDLSWLFFVGMDYHYGPFSSRNMMEQVRIRDLSGHKIAIDGSLLNHDENGSPDNEDSDTLLAAVKATPSIPKQAIFNAFLLERDPRYIYTAVHGAITQAHKERFGETPFAVIGEIKVGESAEVKFGATWTTRLYLNKLDRYLNLIPWDN